MPPSLHLPTQIGHIILPSSIPPLKTSSSSTNTTTHSSSSFTVGKPFNVIKHNHAGSYFMCAGNDRLIHLFNANSGTHITSYSAHGYELTDLCIAPDNATFASVGGDKSVFYWDVGKAVTIRRYAGHFSTLNAVEMSSTGNGGSPSVLVSGSFDATCRVWDLRSRSMVPVQVLQEAGDSVTSLFVNETEIVSGSSDGKIRRYDLRKGRLTTDVIGQPVTSVKMSKDGQMSLVASLDSSVRLLDNANGGLLATYQGHENEKYRIPAVFGQDENYIVCGSEDGRVLMWDIESGRKIGEVKGHHGKVVSGVSVSQKTGQMITCGGDGEIVLWT